MEQKLADRFIDMANAAKVFDEWKPKVDASVAELRSELGRFASPTWWWSSCARKSASKSLPMLPPATAPDRGGQAAVGGAQADDRRPHGVEDKLNTLRSYRRARGLCV